MEINKKKEPEKVESKLMILKENESIARFKTEEIKELEIKLKELVPDLKFKDSIFKKLGLDCKMNNILISKSYYENKKRYKPYFQKPNSVCYHVLLGSSQQSFVRLEDVFSKSSA